MHRRFFNMILTFDASLFCSCNRVGTAAVTHLSNGIPFLESAYTDQCGKMARFLLKICPEVYNFAKEGSKFCQNPSEIARFSNLPNLVALIRVFCFKIIVCFVSKLCRNDETRAKINSLSLF